MNRTDIPWCTHNWNPTSGCNGPNGKPCSYCYARKISARFGRSFAPTCHPERLELPMKTRKPARVFVDSNGDLSDPAIPDEFIDKVFAVMSLCQRHTFLVLTKQEKRMLEWYSETWQTPSGGKEHRNDQVADVAFRMSDADNPEHWTEDEGIIAIHKWPLPNVHIGVTVTNQADANERIPQLSMIPAAVRFVSIEPLIGPVNLEAIDWTIEARKQLKLVGIDYGAAFRATCNSLTGERWDNVIGRASGWPGLDWVIIGELSGKAPSEQVKHWAGDIIDQCRAAGTPVFVKNRLYETFRIQEYPEVVP